MPREHAEAEMRRVAGAFAPDEIPQLARRFAAASGERNALLWRRSIFRPPAVEGAEHARAGVDAPTGTILAFCHVSSFISMFAAMQSIGISSYTVGAERYFQAADKGHTGLTFQRQRSVIERTGHVFVPAPNSMDILKGALQDGETIAIAFDVAGRTPVRMLGQEIKIAAGASRLAAATGARIVPMLFRNDSARVTVWWAPPIEPDPDFAVVEQRLADVFDRVIRDRPWALHEPEFRWA
jgi:lauroyl/myristoyl acyltransferase